MIKRVRADIADLRLNQIIEIQPTKYKVGIAKHLCGTATGMQHGALHFYLSYIFLGEKYVHHI